MVISSAEPSVIAASTTWPLPDVRASVSAASTPTTSSIAPPPQSATRLSGTTGLPPGSPMACSAPESDR